MIATENHMSNTTESVRDAAKAILDKLPDDASWEDVQYHLYVRQQIEAGLVDDAAGRLIDTDDMRRRLVEHKAQRGKAVG
jgi:predicted transcriptional regulator